MSPAEDNKALVRRAVALLFNGGDLGAAPLLFAPRYAEHEQRFTALVRAAFPDLELVVEQQVAEADLVVTRWQAKGTHRGSFLGVEATGHLVEWTGIWLQRIADGRIVEGQDWGSWDRFGVMEQLRGGARR